MSATVDCDEVAVDRKLPPVLRDIPMEEDLSTTFKAESMLMCSSHSSLQEERVDIHLRVAGSEPWACVEGP